MLNSFMQLAAILSDSTALEHHPATILGGEVNATHMNVMYINVENRTSGRRVWAVLMGSNEASHN